MIARRYLKRFASPCQIARNFCLTQDLFKLSYFSNVYNEPLLPYTLGQCIDIGAEKYGAREVVVVPHQNIRKTFTQLKKEVDELAMGFVSVGLKKGDRIGIWSHSIYEWIVTEFAAAKAGLILVTVNPAYQQKELEYCLQKVGMKALVTTETVKCQNYAALLKSTIPSLESSKPGELKDEKFQDLTHVIMISEKQHSGMYNFEKLKVTDGNSAELVRLERLIQFDDPTSILFTSGTTGSPKAATLSHHNLVNSAYVLGKLLDYHKKPHRLCLPTPLYHCFGNVFGVITAVLHGACCVLPFETYSPTAVAEAIHNERATSIYGTPTMFVDILNLKNFQSYDFTSLETGIIGGAPVSEKLYSSITNEMNIKNFKGGFGTTETTAGVYFTNPVKLDKPTLLGPLEIKIVDDKGHIVEYGQSGELCVRGFNIMLGYWNDPEKTKEVLTETHWYKTGDIAKTNKDGHLDIVGRIKDMVIRGGENIFPREIEDFLHAHPSIADAHVVGVPDERMGEELCAWIQLKAGKELTSDDVRTFCKEQLAYFKVPRYILFVKEYPKTITGKVQKFEMRKDSIKLLSLSEKY